MSRASRLRQCPQRCGGGLLQGRSYFGRPEFTCTKCGHRFTAGDSGEPWASVVPMAPQKLSERRP